MFARMTLRDVEIAVSYFHIPKSLRSIEQFHKIRCG